MCDFIIIWFIINCHKFLFQNVLKDRSNSISVGVVLELREEYRNIRNDPMFLEMTDAIEAVEEMDMRAQCNYALLFYSTIKVWSIFLTGYEYRNDQTNLRAFHGHNQSP